jgi:hypothetical protein
VEADVILIDVSAIRDEERVLICFFFLSKII